MTDHHSRWFLYTPTIRAHLVGDVLSVEIRGRFTAARLNTALKTLRTKLARRDYGALVLDAREAHMGITLPELTALWGVDDCPLAVRPCALVFDERQPGAREFYEALGVRLGFGLPPRLIGAFEGALMVAAVHWAQKRAEGYRSEQLRKAGRASSRGSSGKRS